MRLLLALVVLQAACVSSSIELVGDTGPRVDAGIDAGAADVGAADVGAADAGPPPLDAGCQLSAAPPPAECYLGCEEVDPEWNMVTCDYKCEERPSECFTECTPEEDLCSVGFECCDGEVCDLIARNEFGYEQLCAADDVALVYGAACIDNECQVVDFAYCEEDDSCEVVLSRDELCDEVAINVEHRPEYLELLCATHPECCGESILEVTGPATCNEDSFCEAVEF